jgi:integrase
VGELDLDAGRWSIPGTRTKNDCGITVPLHPILVSDLRAVWPNHQPDGSWKLLGNVAGSGLRGYAKVKDKIDALSGVKDWRLHDLRRTARTNLSRLGVSREVAEACLNHVSDRSPLERTYNRHTYEAEIIATIEAWQRHLIGLVTASPTAEVIPLRRRRSR